MFDDEFYLFLGFILVAFGILHEMGLYWFQKTYKGYSKLFGKMGFMVHAIQLGGVWIVIGILLIWIFWEMPPLPFHRSLGITMGGGLLFVVGIGLMGESLRVLGWKRVMKERLFVTPEPPWETSGIFQLFKDPMYLGSQLAMVGLALLLDAWPLLIYALEMRFLQNRLALLERKQV